MFVVKSVLLFRFFFFFIINVKCSLDSSFFDHMMQRRAFVLKADTLGWIFFLNSNAADDNLRQ